MKCEIIVSGTFLMIKNTKYCCIRNEAPKRKTIPDFALVKHSL